MHPSSSTVAADTSQNCRQPSSPVETALGLALASTIGFGIVVMTIALAWFVMPRFMSIYQDMDVALPTLTLMVFEHGRWALPLVGIFFAILLVAHEVMLHLVTLPRWAGWLIRVTILLGFAIFVLMVVLAIWLPLTEVMESL